VGGEEGGRCCSDDGSVEGGKEEENAFWRRGEVRKGGGEAGKVLCGVREVSCA